MAAAAEIAPELRIDRPIDLSSRDFIENKESWYARIRDEAPIIGALVATVDSAVATRVTRDCSMRFVSAARCTS